MKKFTILFFAAFLIYACNSGANSEQNGIEEIESSDSTATSNNDGWMERGEFITADGAIDIESFKKEVEGKETFETKIETKIMSCCQKKGCWMKVDLGDGEEMRVTFKDYGFFVPLDAAGKTVIMEGKAYYDTTSVDMLRHYAEDAGESPEEIAKITEPKLELAFEATGVLLK